jgi:CBS domain-containing protein
MVDWPSGKTVLVEALLIKARERLVTIAEDAPLVEVAKLLQAGSDLVIIIDTAGILKGVITKTDVVARVSHCFDDVCRTASSVVMARDVVLCRPQDLLKDVWITMKARNFQHVPVVDDESRPVGLLHARDILQLLLSNSESEDDMLRDYVMGVGYR